MVPKHFPRVASGVLLATSWAIGSFACDTTTDATAQATESTRGHACSAEMVAKCTPAMATACKTQGASAVTASAQGASSCCKSRAMAATASAGGPGKVLAVVASSSGCAYGASTTTCRTVKTSTMAAPSGKVEAVLVGGGYSCNGHGKSAQRGAAHECDACADMASCDEEVRGAGAITQVVKLKNGIMYVYTAAPGKARALQTALAQRNERLTAINASGDKVKLCAECKTMRGAMASGKLTREVVGIEGGSLTLMTSNDAAMVKKLHGMAGTTLAAKPKI